MEPKLLQILRSKGGNTPEQELLKELACTRDMLLNAMANLNGHGYKIILENQKWELVQEPDTPFPWEFPGRQNTIHYLPVTTSTMDVARQLAKEGCPHLAVAVADRQTRGRGRMDRRWASDHGGLYFTMVLRPDLPPSDGFRFTFLASVVLADLLKKLCRIDVGVKWPNDLITGQGKLAGILSEMHTTSGNIDFLNIGIGINVNNTPTGLETRAVSVKMLTGRKFSRTALLREFLDRFEKELHGSNDFNDVISRWKKLAHSLNRQVKIVTRNKIVEGFAHDVDEHGSLVVRLADGTISKVRHGDCFHV